MSDQKFYRNRIRLTTLCGFCGGEFTEEEREEVNYVHSSWTGIFYHGYDCKRPEGYIPVVKEPPKEPEEKRPVKRTRRTYTKRKK